MKGNKDDKALGAWKEEDGGNVIAIAGKKMYALMDTNRPDKLKDGILIDDTCVKKASKGVNLHHLAIAAIARGDTVEARNDAPTFKIGQKVNFDKDGEAKENKEPFEHKFITRNIRRTGLRSTQKELAL
jgi:hypothetical protein